VQGKFKSSAGRNAANPARPVRKGPMLFLLARRKSMIEGGIFWLLFDQAKSDKAPCNGKSLTFFKTLHVRHCQLIIFFETWLQKVQCTYKYKISKKEK
jgi:hypothetical protein